MQDLSRGPPQRSSASRSRTTTIASDPETQDPHLALAWWGSFVALGGSMPLGSLMLACTAWGGLRLTKVQRRVVADGAFYEVSCAVAADEVTAPSAQVLDELRSGMWADPEAEVLPDEYQPRLRTRLLAHVTQLAQDGELPPHAFNRLDDGIWELKVESIRMTFFDTDGAGNWTPKMGGRIETWDGHRWDLPEDFDEYIRLGHCFAKEGQKTPPEHIEASCTMREEDVYHDRKS